MNFMIARAGKHLWEEPVLSGKRGSGTIFFSGCALKCVYCQNYEISRGQKGFRVSADELVALMLWLEREGAHNINLVTPSHYAKFLPDVLRRVKVSLRIPIVYNSGGYDKTEDIKNLEGLVDIYLPDFKYANTVIAERYSGAADYFSVATDALAEMRRQQPKDIFKNRLMQNGVIVRHLILPSLVADSFRVLSAIAEIDRTLYVSLMAQYFVSAGLNTTKFPELNRRITLQEYDAVAEHFFKTGLRNGFTQDLDSAVEAYVPDFDTEALKKLVDSLTKR